MKSAIEKLLIVTVLFLLMTIDSYSTKTIAIGTGVFLTALSITAYRNRRVNAPHFPKAKDATELTDWLRQTIDKIDRMDDK